MTTAKWFVWMGLISYPLYLWHWPILSFLRITQNGILSHKLAALGVFVSMLLSVLTFLFIEKPLKKFSSSGKMALFLTSLLAILGGSSFVLFKIPPQRSELAIGKLELKKEFSLLIHRPEENCIETDVPANINNHCAIKHPQSDPTIALIGDSHAISTFMGFSIVFNTFGENLIGLARGGCTPFMNLESQIIHTKDYCVEMNNTAYQYIIKKTSIHTVIMNSRGPLYLTGKGFEEPEHDRYIKYIKKSNARFEEAFQLAMESSIETLLKAGKKIIFMIDLPELGFDPMTCVEPRPLSLSERRQFCGVSFEVVSERNKQYWGVVQRVLKKFPAVKVFDQSKVLCNLNSCRAIMDGEIIYRDDDHLSMEGGIFMGKKLLQLL